MFYISHRMTQYNTSSPTVPADLDESVPPLPPPMPPLEELIKKNRAKITTREAAVNIDAKKLALKRRQRKQVRVINKNNP